MRLAVAVLVPVASLNLPHDVCHGRFGVVHQAKSRDVCTVVFVVLHVYQVGVLLRENDYYYILIHCSVEIHLTL